MTKRLPTSDIADMPAPKRRLRRNLGDVIKNMTANNKVFLGEYVFHIYFKNNSHITLNVKYINIIFVNLFSVQN